MTIEENVLCSFSMRLEYNINTTFLNITFDTMLIHQVFTLIGGLI